jgi:hypothetical protein
VITEQYDDIEFHESLGSDTCIVVQQQRQRVFTGETGYTDALRFYNDLVMNKVYNLNRRVW